MNRNLKRLWEIGRIVLAVALLVWLFSKVNLRQTIQTIGAFHAPWLLAALAAYLGFVLVSAWRWKILLDCQELRFSFASLLRFYFIALLFNNILPTSIGGDVMRVVYTARDNKRANAFSATFIDRMIGFIGLFTFALAVSVFVFILRGRQEFLFFSLAGLAFLVVLTSALFSVRIYRWFSRRVRRITLFRLGERIDRVYEAVTRYRNHRTALGVSFALSLAVQAFIAFTWFFVNLAASGIPSVVPFLLYIPVVGVISMIPVTPGGLGLREASFFALITRAGLGHDRAVGVALTALVISIIFALAGGIIFMFTGRKKGQPT